MCSYFVKQITNIYLNNSANSVTETAKTLNKHFFLLSLQKNLSCFKNVSRLVIPTSSPSSFLLMPALLSVLPPPAHPPKVSLEKGEERAPTAKRDRKERPGKEGRRSMARKIGLCHLLWAHTDIRRNDNPAFNGVGVTMQTWDSYFGRTAYLHFFLISIKATVRSSPEFTN